jgi:aerobic carbon-monoxide dehydrogenase medium subunit
VIPAPFDYVRPGTVDEAVTALQQAGEDAKILAGGQSLIPVLRLRLAAPSTLIDLGGIPQLRRIRDDGDRIAIGAMAPHHEVMRDELVKEHVGLLAQATATVADNQVRHRGTLGGALAHADPAGDLGGVALALEAELVITGPGGQRTVSADDFFVDYFTTALDEGDLITEIRIPAGQSQGAYAKFNRRTADWALMAAAVSKGAGGWRVALCGAGPTAVRAAGVEAALASGASAADASLHASEGIDPEADLGGSAEYKRHLACVMVRRALEAAGG